MPLYLAQLRKAINTGGFAAKWSNRYFLNAPTFGDAEGYAQQLWFDVESVFHGELAFCYEIYINLVGDAPGNPGTIVPVAVPNQRGQQPQAGVAGVQSLLPLFNCVRVDFGVEVSRVSRKFYRIPLQEVDIENAQLIPANVTAILNAWGAAFAAGIPVVDPDNQAWTGAVAVKGLTSRRLGREAQIGVPSAPPFG